MTPLKELLHERLRNIIFPPVCFGCHTVGAYLCKNCKKSVKSHPEMCPFCHRPTKHWLVCLNCKSDHRHIEGIIVGFIYTATIKKLITTLKWWHRYHIAPFLAERLALLVRSHELLYPELIGIGKASSLQNGKTSSLQNSETHSRTAPKNNLIITSVPTHWRKKLFVRWYSQSECLARGLADVLEVLYVPLSKKSKYTISQTKLSRSKRLINLLGAFVVQKNMLLKWDETVLIVDDITTTWATIDELARTLKSSYKQVTIWWIVVGRHGK